MKLELLAVCVLALFFILIAAVSHHQNYQWSGSDGEAEKTVSQITGDSYRPWFASIYKPASGEIESLLFALQAAIGSLIIGYFLGYYRAMARKKTD